MPRERRRRRFIFIFSPLRRRTRQYSLRYSRGVLLYPLSSLRRCSSRGVVSLKFSERGTLLLVRALCISSLPLAPKSRFVSSASPRELLYSLSLSLFDRRTRFARPSPREGEEILSVRVCSFFDSPRSTMSMERALDDDDESGKRNDVSGRSILFFLVLCTLVLKMGDTN